IDLGGSGADYDITVSQAQPGNFIVGSSGGTFGERSSISADDERISSTGLSATNTDYTFVSGPHDDPTNPDTSDYVLPGEYALITDTNAIERAGTVTDDPIGTIPGNTGSANVYEELVDNTNPGLGYFAFFDLSPANQGSALYSEGLTGLTVGRTYEFSFLAANVFTESGNGASRPANANTAVDLQVDGVSIGNTGIIPHQQGEWLKYSGTFVATATTATVEFINDSTGGFLGADLAIDNLAVVETIQATATINNTNSDIDGDGIPNACDHDSDNGGVMDVIEVGGIDSDGDGQWDDGSGNVTVDADGVPIQAAGGVDLTTVPNNPYVREPGHEAPDAIDDAETTDSQTVVNVDLLGADDSTAADSSPTGASLSVTQINNVAAGGNLTLPSGASITVLANGTVDYDPSTATGLTYSGGTAVDTFTYTISDGNGGTDVATATVTIDNLAPVALNDSVGVCERENISILSNDSDPDVDLLTITQIDGSNITAGGSATIASGAIVTVNNDGTIDYDNNNAFILGLGETAVDTFTYSISDGNGGTSMATVSVQHSGPDAIVFNETFGTGGRTDVGGLANTASTTYLYEDGTGSGNVDGRIRDGDYTIDSTISPTNHGSWFTRNWSGSDHTGDTDGRFLMVNADFDPGEFYRTSVTGLTAGDEYGFRAYIQNPNNTGTSQPNVRFAIYDGATLIGYADSGNISSDGDWHAVEFQFTSPVSDVSIVLVNNGPGGDGNDLLIDDISLVHFPCTTVPPVVIDMDGDGVEFDNIDDGISTDVDSDGELEQTAWADEDDAVLIYDANGDNGVDGNEEYNFAQYSDDPNATDMEGLAAAFDSNQDGVLSAEDEQFDSFKLWQDADGNGQVGEGEMITLEEAGIESIGLVSDGESYTAADGDVTVHGESQVTYSDGSTGIAADAEFTYDNSFETAELEITTDAGEIHNLDEPTVVVAPEVETSSGSDVDEVPVGHSIEDEITLASSNAGLI
ncbi:MAG: Ig-like domain-containing protein, partial [Verrucomicrobiota bacterium]